FGFVTHDFLDVPPGSHAHVALRALGDELVAALGEHLNVHQPLGVPVVEVGDGVAVIFRGTDKFTGTVLIENQVVADIVGPVGEAKTGVENVLTPAPLIKAGGHGNGSTGF